MDPNSEARLKEVHPSLSSKIHQLVTMLADENIVFRVTQGLRSWSQQSAFYAQGRESTDAVNQLRASVGLPAIADADNKIITNCPAGYSWHQFGMAVDVVPEASIQSDGSFIPDWNPQHPEWLRLIAVGESLGLYSGSEFKTFKDYPHFQLTGRFGANPDDEVRQLWKDGGISAVWDESQIQ